MKALIIIDKLSDLIRTIKMGKFTLLSALAASAGVTNAAVVFGEKTDEQTLFSNVEGVSTTTGIGPAAVGKKVMVPSPLDCLTPLPIRSIACGAHHSFIVSHSGAVYAWGKNNKGQLGLGDTDDRIFPTQVRSLRNQKVCHEFI